MSLPGEQEIKLSDEAVRLAIGEHLSRSLTAGVRCLDIQRDYNRNSDWFATITTDAPAGAAQSE